MISPEPVNNHLKAFQEIVPSLPRRAIREFGVYNGDSTAQLVTFGRSVYAFDTFQGMPEIGFEKEMDWDNPPGKFKPTHDVEAFLKTIGVTTFKGRFEDTLPTVNKKVKFAFVYIDCDWYSGHKEIITWLMETKRMVEGGVALLDDYLVLEGARRGDRKSVV